MQPGIPHFAAYVDRIFGSHDFRIEVDILNLDEHPVGSGVFLDGQVNLMDGDGVRRTASLTLSDPAGVLDFAGASEWSDTSVWVNRLVRVRHTIKVPGVGNVTVTPFIGPPVTFSRDGAQVQVECQDKTALAVRGCPPFTVHKGANAADAITGILARGTGEFRFRIPDYGRRLSQPYSVGWTDDASPWVVASRIARAEMGLQLIYSCDGYATLRPVPDSPVMRVPGVTGQPKGTVDFTTFANWVRVLGAQAEVTNGDVTTTTQPEAIAVIPDRELLSPESLARRGVPRYLPLLVDEDAIATLEDARARAERELAAVSRLEASQTFTCVPFFHCDADDVVVLTAPGGDIRVRLGDASIPLGVGGDMSIGAHRWVSRAPGARVSGQVLTTTRTEAPEPGESAGPAAKGGKKKTKKGTKAKKKKGRK